MKYDTFLSKFGLLKNVSINIFLIFRSVKPFAFCFTFIMYYIFYKTRSVQKNYNTTLFFKKDATKNSWQFMTDSRTKRGFLWFLRFIKSHYGISAPDAKFKNESKAILALLVVLSSEYASVYHALGNRLRLSATRLERRLTWHAGGKLYR